MGGKSLIFVSIVLVFTTLSAAEPRREAVLLDIRGPIGPATSDYIVRGLTKAGAALVVLRMDTPGGLDTSMRDIIRAVLASPVPVVSYVAPSGARAASAGTYISYASHVAAMAPGTNLGAATPVQIGAPALPSGAPDRDKDGDKSGSKDRPEKPSDTGGPPPTLGDKAVSDAVAYIRSLAQMRGRNAEWAVKAVREAASLPAEEALRERVIDVIADSVNDLLIKIDGREVNVQGAVRRLETKELSIVEFAPDWRTGLLAVITNPNVASILMLIGVYALLFEFYSPGLVAPGVVGVICLLLAFYAFQLLPINYTGLALTLLGLALMAAEAFVPSFGALGIGGLVAFVIGSVMLIDTDAPGFSVAWPIVGSVALLAGAIFAATITLALRARRRAVVTGPEQMIHSTGPVLRWVGQEGSVRVHGEIWHARSKGPLKPGERVRVTAIDGLTLVVEPEAQRR